MIQIIKEAKTVIVIGNESHQFIYNYCQEWLYLKENISYENFIIINPNNNLDLIYNWKIFFRDEINE